jgi:hypothetical protein
MNRCTALIAILLLVILAAGCAPGNERWSSVDNRANFWAGLWHGLIIIVTFVVSLFTRDVGIYEANNIGWGYNIGFILGCMISLGGGIRGATHRKAKVKVSGGDWNKLGDKIASGVREGVRSGMAGHDVSDADWDELGRRIEERIKEKLRDLKED